MNNNDETLMKLGQNNGQKKYFIFFYIKRINLSLSLSRSQDFFVKNHQKAMVNFVFLWKNVIRKRKQNKQRNFFGKKKFPVSKMETKHANKNKKNDDFFRCESCHKWLFRVSFFLFWLLSNFQTHAQQTNKKQKNCNNLTWLCVDQKKQKCTTHTPGRFLHSIWLSKKKEFSQWKN